MYDTEMLIEKGKATLQQKDKVKQRNSPKLYKDSMGYMLHIRRKQIWMPDMYVYILRNIQPAK